MELSYLTCLYQGNTESTVEGKRGHPRRIERKRGFNSSPMNEHIHHYKKDKKDKKGAPSINLEYLSMYLSKV